MSQEMNMADPKRAEDRQAFNVCTAACERVPQEAPLTLLSARFGSTSYEDTRTTHWRMANGEWRWMVGGGGSGGGGVGKSLSMT